MLLFSFMVIPLLLTCFCMYYKNKDIVPVVVMGLVAGILVCAFKTFFLFSHRVVPYSLSENYVYLFFRQAFIPVILLYAIFFIFSKDSLDYKINAYFPLELSFFTVFLPYLTVSSSEGLYSTYSLFVKPFVFAGMIIMTAIMVRWAYKTFTLKKIYFTVIFVLLALGYIMLPALFEAMYLIKEKVALVMIFSSLYFILPFILIFLTGIKKIKI